MKNNTSRFSKLILTCVPFLLLGTTLVNAEETSTISSETISSTTDSINIQKVTETNDNEEATTTSTSKDETETKVVKKIISD